MEETFRDRDEELITNATAVGAGAVLIGVGVTLAYLLSKGRGRVFRSLTIPARLIIDGDCVKQEPPRVEIEIDETQPNTIFFVEWTVSGDISNRRWVSFEDFKRKIEFHSGGGGSDSKSITPLELEHGNRCAADLSINRRFKRRIGRQAIRDVARGSTHIYKWDIWLDRQKSDDPEIAIIRR